MTIITPTGITGITSITSTGNTLQFQNPSGADVSVSGLNVTSGTNINVTGIVTASGFVGNVTGNVSGNVTGNVSGNVTGNINSTGVSTVTTLRATSLVGVNTVGVVTVYASGSLQSNSIVPVGGLQSGVNAGGVIQFQHYQNSTRTTLSNAANFTLWSVGNFVKASSNSVLHITGQLVFGDGESYNMGPYWKIGASGNRYDGIIFTHYDSDNGSAASIKVSWHIDAYYDTSATGSQAIEIGWSTANGGLDRPGQVWNPNAADDARSRQFSSDVTIFELGK